MQVINPFFNTQTTISDVDQLADRLLALSDKDTQLISDVLSLAQEDASLLSKLNQHTTVIDQQAAMITQLKTDVSHAQALAGASCENLLINPRGKINQANESDGVLAAGVYFCDGWKAGANGAEVYRDADGFRLVSGSMVQLVPNNVGPNQPLRGNLTTVSGTPQIKINGGTDSAQSDSAEYIQFEVSGDNSKFTKLVLAESAALPIYWQQADELSPCQKFYIDTGDVHGGTFGGSYSTSTQYACYMFGSIPENMHPLKSTTLKVRANASTDVSSGWSIQMITHTGTLIMRNSHSAITIAGDYFYRLIIDARP